MTWSSGNANTKSKSFLPDAPNIEVIYDTFHRTTTRATHEGLLMEGLRLSTLKQDEHGDLRGSDHRNIIPYVYGDDCCIDVCVLQTCVELT
jgi:hypothetical protein